MERAIFAILYGYERAQCVFGVSKETLQKEIMSSEFGQGFWRKQKDILTEALKSISVQESSNFFNLPQCFVEILIAENQGDQQKLKILSQEFKKYVKQLDASKNSDKSSSKTQAPKKQSDQKKEHINNVAKTQEKEREVAAELSEEIEEDEGDQIKKKQKISDQVVKEHQNKEYNSNEKQKNPDGKYSWTLIFTDNEKVKILEEYEKNNDISIIEDRYNVPAFLVQH